MSNPNPFDRTLDDGTLVSCVTAEDRACRVARMTRDECQRVLALDGMQKTVLAATRKRLRALEKSGD